MRWVLSIFRLRREPPHWRELPLLLAKCAVWGALSGPVFALFFAAMDGTETLRRFAGSPIALLSGVASGIVWALAFYVPCGLGSMYLRRRISGYPHSIVSTVLVVYNMIACSLAFVFAATVNARMGGVSQEIPMPLFWRIVVVDSLLGGVLALVIGAFIKLRAEVERAQADLRIQEVETARAQARALQSQINPHFFFNTLNTISALVDDDPAAARRTIARLADMFRYTLGCTHEETVALEQELQFVRDYLAIEQARFRDRLRIELPEGPLPELRVPGLVLQPLVENAVKHGIARSIGGGTVSVRILREGAATRVAVRNTAEEEEPVPESSLYRAGHALDNVRARLRLFTGKAEPLSLARNGEWTEFSFLI